MNNLRMTVKDDSGEECPIENIRTFQKHLQLFHKKGVTTHDENRHYFMVGNTFRQKIDRNGEGTIWIMDFLDRM